MYKCDKCNKEFPSGLSLGGHKSSHKRLGSKYPKVNFQIEIECLYCNQLFSRKKKSTKYCSKSCSNMFMWKNKRDNKILFGKTYKFLVEYVENQKFCEICGRADRYTQSGKARKLAFDHDHKTGKFRGLLCFVCNTRYEWYIENKLSVEKYHFKNLGL